MPGNSFGQAFRITTCGESHGGALGVIIDGCPPGLDITQEEIQTELDRRKPGQSEITSTRKESDLIHILSGVFEGKTTGTPILLLAYNQDARPEDYDHLKDLYRPSHADFTYEMKYGHRDYRGSGRASARETLARVAAGAIAKKYLKLKGIEILAYVQQVGLIKTEIPNEQVTARAIESNIIRCPDPEIAAKMIEYIQEIQVQGDSIGGVVKCLIRGLPAGLGEPVFDKLHAELGKGMLSINAVKGFDLGSGFDSLGLKGSEHNDPFILSEGKIRTRTNHAGGVLGGISTGEDLYCRVVFKPVATINQLQDTLTRDLKSVEFKAEGRHDPCVLPRAVPIVEAMAALVLMDLDLRRNSCIQTTI